MSKIRNRSVRTLPTNDSSNLLQIHNINTKFRHDHLTHNRFFGDTVKNFEFPFQQSKFFERTLSPSWPSSLSNSESEVEPVKLNLKKLNCDISSSSSVSWSDEFEKEATKKVQHELEQMDRVLRGEEPIPDLYDKEEYSEWMEIFPGLSILGDERRPQSKGIGKCIDPTLEQSDEQCCYSNVCDTEFTSRQIRKLKETVIDTIFHNVSSKLLQDRANRNEKDPKQMDNKMRQRTMFTISHKPKSLEVDKYLKVSQIKNKVQERKQSSKSLYESMPSPKLESSPEFTSLPFLTEEIPVIKTRKNVSQKTYENIKKKLNDNLVLPPIENSSNFRSISATPRQDKQCLLPFSVKFDNMKNVQQNTQLGLDSFFDDKIFPKKSPVFFLNNR